MIFIEKISRLTLTATRLAYSLYFRVPIAEFVPLAAFAARYRRGWHG